MANARKHKLEKKEPESRSNAYYAEVCSDLIRRRNELQDQPLGGQPGSWANLELREIKSAFDRINRRSYGICVSCEEQIPLKRLRLHPYVLNCVECQQEDELISRRRGNPRHLELI
jgi:RNA polymerase-binding transcription factor DksA